MEFNENNPAHEKAYNAAYEAGAEKAEDEYNSDKIEMDYGYNSTIEIECTYTDEDGTEYTETKEIDVSEYIDVSDLISSYSQDELKGDCESIRDDFIQAYATRYADEHWPEFLPQDDIQAKIDELTDSIQNLKDYHDKICQKAWDVENLKLAAGDTGAFPLLKAAQGLIESARDIVSQKRREFEEQVDKLKAEQAKAEAPAEDQKPEQPEEASQ